MGRIDRSRGQDATMERRHIYAMLRHMEEYEAVKQKRHAKFKTAQEFYEARGVCKQNFLKYYRRYVRSQRKIESLIPHRSGRKFKDSLDYAPEVIEEIKHIRSKGYNRYDIVNILKKKEIVDLSASGVYRLMKKLGINHLNPVLKHEKRKIIKMAAGELGHIDIHYLAKGTIKELGDKKLYLVGLLDDYSRVCWVEVIDSIKSLDVMFASMDMLLKLKERYGIQFKEMLSDNGSEFSSKKNDQHPFERMLKYFDIKHRYTKTWSPQTNGKIERFWKTIEDELLSGEVFETLDEFEQYLLGYVIYYNEHRMHQGINNKIPHKMIA